MNISSWLISVVLNVTRYAVADAESSPAPLSDWKVFVVGGTYQSLVVCVARGSYSLSYMNKINIRRTVFGYRG